MISWRNAGGEPDVVAKLLPLMADEGLNESALNPNAVMMTPLVLEIIAEKQ